MLRLILTTYLMVFVTASELAAEQPVIEGRVRLNSGEPAAPAQVVIFDLANLRQGAVAHATTDAAGYFALSLATLKGRAVPQDFTLGQNYPNPFNPSTIIPYQLSASAHVRLEVFNLLGQRIVTLVDGERSAGSHTAVWNATDAAGQAVGAGVYIYRLSSGDMLSSRRMVLIDGQAGVGTVPHQVEQTATEVGIQVYGLAVSGPGLVAYVDPEFQVGAGMGPVEIILEAVDKGTRGKVMTGGILGDVDNNGRVNFFDALIVAFYSGDSSIVIPNNGDIFLGDVNQDGQVTFLDAYLIATYIADPSDPSLPDGIGKPVSPATASPSPDSLIVEIHSSMFEKSIGTSLGEVAFSPDGKYIATHYDSVRLWDLRSGTKVWEMLTTEDEVAFRPDGEYLAISINNIAGDRVSIREVPSGREVAYTGVDGTSVKATEVHAIAFSPDGRYLAIGVDHPYTWLWDLSNGEFSGWGRTDNNANHDLAFSPDGKHLAVGGEDGKIALYDVGRWWGDSYPEIWTVETTYSWVPVRAVAFSPDGKYIATGDKRSEVVIYDASSGTEGWRIDVSDEFYDVYSIDFSPEGEFFAVAGDGNYPFRGIGFWKIGLRTRVKEIQTGEDEIFNIAWSPDGRFISDGSKIYRVP